MKYVTPRYEQTVIKAKDILTASSEKYEIEQNNNGSGNVIMNALDIFR